MDWKIFFTTFLTIFLAEMGDKTQIAAFTLAGSSKKPWTIFTAASLGLVLVTALGVLFGGIIAERIPAPLIKKGSAILFIAIGVWTWVKG